MVEGFGQYKSFARAAKEAGFAKDEIKLTVIDPGLILEGANDTLREKLTPETLVSFFRTLQGDSQADDRSLVQIGNFLYMYRTDKDQENRKNGRRKLVRQEEKPIPINEHDRKLIKLACGLLEDSFYEGRLAHLPENQAGAVAFVVNTLAKIIDQKILANSADLFDADRLRAFTETVGKFEQRTLFPGTDQESTLSPRAQRLEEMKQKFSAQLEIIDRIEKDTDWSKYFYNFANTLTEASNIIYTSGIDNYFAQVIHSISWFLEAEWKPIVETGRQFSRYLHDTDTRIKPDDKKARQFSSDSFSLEKFLAEMAGEKLKNPDLDPASTVYIRLNDVRRGRSLKIIREKLGKVTTSGTKRFSTFEDFGKSHAAENLSETIKTIEPLFETPTEPLLGYQRAIREALRILRERDTLRRTDDMFTIGKRRWKSGASDPRAVPYLIKHYLIASSMIEKGSEDDKMRREKSLASLSFPFNWSERGEQETTHPIIGEKKFDGVEQKWILEGPEYANLHFLEQDLPFAVWIRRYFLSKN